MKLPDMLRTESERTLAAVRYRLGRNTFRFLCETHLELPPQPPPGCRTLVLFAHFDLQGIVDPYVAYYLKALHGLGATIVFVSGSPTLTPESVAPIRSLCAGIYTRRTLSLDFGSWHLAWCILRQRGWSLDQFDRFVIANDSVFGPLFPIEEMWSSFHDADMYGAIENTQMVPHLQSFFLAWDLNSRTRPFLNDFWNDFQYVVHKGTLIWRYEIGLSKRARKAGLSIKPFVSAAAIKTTYGSSSAHRGPAGAPGEITAPFTSGTASSRTSDSLSSRRSAALRTSRGTSPWRTCATSSSNTPPIPTDSSNRTWTGSAAQHLKCAGAPAGRGLTGENEHHRPCSKRRQRAPAVAHISQHASCRRCLPRDRRPR